MSVEKKDIQYIHKAGGLCVFFLFQTRQHFHLSFTILFCHPVPCVASVDSTFSVFPLFLVLVFTVSLVCRYPFHLSPVPSFFFGSAFVALVYKVLMGYVGIASCVRSV